MQALPGTIEILLHFKKNQGRRQWKNMKSHAYRWIRQRQHVFATMALVRHAPARSGVYSNRMKSQLTHDLNAWSALVVQRLARFRCEQIILLQNIRRVERSHVHMMLSSYVKHRTTCGSILKMALQFIGRKLATSFGGPSFPIRPTNLRWTSCICGL